MRKPLLIVALAFGAVGALVSRAQTPVAVTPPRGAGGSSVGGAARPPARSGSGALPALVKWRIDVSPAAPRVGQEVRISFPRPGASDQTLWPLRVSFGGGASRADDFLSCDAVGLSCPGEATYKVAYGSPGEKVVKILWSTWSQGDFTAEARFQVSLPVNAAVKLPTPTPKPQSNRVPLPN